ncbi:Carotenoid biosynthesis protein [Balamuthia mandrillaris]
MMGLVEFSLMMSTERYGECVDSNAYTGWLVRFLDPIRWKKRKEEKVDENDRNGAATMERPADHVQGEALHEASERAGGSVHHPPGPHLASLFLLWVVLSTWVLEEVGVASGVLPFGKYEYAGHVSHVMVHRVPIDVPLSWYMMLWPSFCIAATIVNEEPHLRGQRRPWPKVVLISVFAAYIMTCWDLLLDPLGSTLSGLWIWKNNGGIYFGVPLLNFFGWFLVSFLIIFLYLVGERFFDVRPVGGGPSSASNGGVPLLINVLPLIAFLCMTLFYVLMSQPVSLCLIAVFVMGVPIIYAGFRLAHSRLAIRTLNSDYELVFDE